MGVKTLSDIRSGAPLDDTQRTGAKDRDYTA